MQNMPVIIHLWMKIVIVMHVRTLIGPISDIYSRVAKCWGYALLHGII